ncbi:MAG: hypothetical protein RMN51_09515 [Verrucomicrobiota bacterium]|nr:hypothetical protein [Limisphaera sp.]MDW8382329.1 hypothetical protein [Verrucomicrobiota bacterium]
MAAETHADTSPSVPAGPNDSQASAEPVVRIRTRACVWILQGLSALIAAAGVTWTVHHLAWPMVRGLLETWNKPVECREGRWLWPNEEARVLIETRDLAVVLDPGLTGEMRLPALFEVHLGQERLRLYGPTSVWEWPYPRSWTFRADPATWLAVSEAWRPFVLGALGLGVATGLLVVWRMLGIVYWLGILLLAVMVRRVPETGRVWRMAMLFQLPGAWLFTAAIVGYGAGAVDLFSLAVAWGLHWMLTWLLMGMAPFLLPRRASACTVSDNPFLAHR